MGLDWDEGVEAGGEHGPYRQIGAPPHLSRARGGAAVEGARLPLLLLRGAARGGSPGRVEGRAAAEVCRALPRHPARRGAPPDRERRAGGHPLPRARRPRRRLQRRRPRRGALQHRRHRRSGARAVRRHPRLQLRRRHRRCADGGHACDPGRGSHLEYAAADPAVRGVRMEAAGLRARVARDGAGPQSAVETSRRDLGDGVPRSRVPAGGVDELPGADRLVARAKARSCCRSRSWRDASGSRTSGTAPACSMSRSWRGSTGIT